MTVAPELATCRCPDGGVRSGSLHNGKPHRDCRRCSRQLTTQSWHLTADHIREFLASAEEAVPDLNHDQVAHFGSRAITRALSDQAVKDYELHGFLHRELRGEPEAECLDAANYAAFQMLKDRKAVEDGTLDQIKADENYRTLLSLTVDTMRLHERWERFWAERG